MEFSGAKAISALGLNNKKQTEEANTNFTFFKKTPIHLTIGVFFDGTLNNKFNSDKVYYKKLNSKNFIEDKIPDEITIKVKDKKTKKVVDKTIEKDSSYWNPYSNVALLHDIYKEENIEGRVENNKIVSTLKIYVQGIGTQRDKSDDIPGKAFGEGNNGIIGKVAEGCVDIAKQIDDILKKNKNSEITSITFDVFGFSRGAASARHFCNEILGKESIETIAKTENITSNKKVIAQVSLSVAHPRKIEIPTGKRYTLGVLGKILKTLKTQHSIEQNFNEKEDAVKIRFLGLFDTVVSQFIIKDDYGENLDDKIASLSPIPNIPIFTLAQLTLDKVKQKVDHLPIDYIVHLTAQDEWRYNFSSTPIGKNGFEYNLHGAHSDIGGGYAAEIKEEAVIEFFNIKIGNYNDPNYNFEIPKNYQKLKDFYTQKKYCNANEITFIKVGDIKEVKVIDNYNTLVTVAEKYQLKTVRQIIPRYSIVNMNIIKTLAESVGLNFNAKATKNRAFEYKTPDELKKYSEIIISNLKIMFENYYTKKQKLKPNELQKKLTPISEQMLKTIKNKFVHFSANYNNTIINKGLVDLLNNEILNKIAYANHPRYKDEKKDSYLREKYTPSK